LFCLSCAATVSLQLVDVPLHVHGTKKHLYTVNEKTNDISVFTVDPSSGNLSASGRFASFLTPHWIQSSPPGAYAYIASMMARQPPSPHKRSTVQAAL